MRRTSNELQEIQSKFDSFDGKSLNGNRIKLLKVIKDAIEKDGFTRKDNEDIVELSYYGEPGMKPDITIGVEKGNIWVNTDIFWKTIYGQLEHEQEHREYMRDF